MSFNLIDDHKVKPYAWVNTFIYLSQGIKVKTAKLHKKLKEKPNNWNSVILQRKVKQSMTNVCMVHCTWKENDYQ